MNKMHETLRVAILGPTGQIGHAILLALLTGTSHEVIQLVSPQSEDKARSVALASEQSERITTAPVDLLGSDIDHIATILDGVDVVVSALNGKALDAQGKVQDAAAKAGVRRFYPSEYGMHHVYRPDSEDDNYGYLHPVRVESIPSYRTLPANSATNDVDLERKVPGQRASSASSSNCVWEDDIHAHRLRGLLQPTQGSDLVSMDATQCVLLPDHHLG